jgi:predicted PurR-regulated permease PerM
MERRHILILFTAVVLLNFAIFYKIFTPLVFALLVSYLLLPLNDFFEKIFKNRDAASIATVLIIVVPFVILVAVLLDILVTETVRIVANPDAILTKIHSFEEYLKNAGVDISFSSQVTDIIEKIENSLDITTAYDLLKNISYTVLHILLFIFSTFYFLRDGKRLKKAVDTFIPVEIKVVYVKLTKELEKALQGLFYGYVLTAGIVSILAGITFYLLGEWFDVSYLVNYSILLAFLIFVFGLLPILGAPMIYIPLAIVEIFSHPPLAVIILIFGVIVLTYFPMFVLTPYIAEKRSEIHPLIILFSFIVGPLAFGVSGFVLGPVFLCLLVAVYRVKKNEDTHSGSE